MAPPKLLPADENAVRRIAKIIGPGSAADAALAELDMRRRTGQDVALFQGQSFWIVGPSLNASATADRPKAVNND